MAFSSSKAGRVYNALLERKGRVFSTKEIRQMCRLLKVDFNVAMVGLNRAGVLEPVVFKGIYYLRDREERDLRTIKEDPLLIVANACKLRLGTDWYFGLATALQLAGLWKQQTLTKMTVISKKRVYGSKMPIAGMQVEFKQLIGVPYERLIKECGSMRYSDPARTILDYAYFAARNKESHHYAQTVFAEVAETLGEENIMNKAKPLIGKYPGLYAIFLKKFFETKAL